MTDWSNLGPNPDEAYEHHRLAMVEHFVFLFRCDPDYARYAVSTYIKNPNCMWPKIGHDVKTRLQELGLA